MGLTSTAGLTSRLWRARGREELSNRWPFLLLVITGPYGYQTSTALTAGSSPVAQSDAATLVFIFSVSASRVPGNCPARAAEACLTCWPPAVAGRGHRAALAPGTRACGAKP